MDEEKHLTRGSIFGAISSSSSSSSSTEMGTAAAAAPSLQRAYLHDALHRDTHGVLRLGNRPSSTTTNDTNSSSRIARVGCVRDDGESREVLPEITPLNVS
jgi:hypothetical protein